jgi:hypothetical protein
MPSPALACFKISIGSPFKSFSIKIETLEYHRHKASIFPQRANEGSTPRANKKGLHKACFVLSTQSRRAERGFHGARECSPDLRIELRPDFFLGKSRKASHRDGKRETTKRQGKSGDTSATGPCSGNAERYYERGFRGRRGGRTKASRFRRLGLVQIVRSTG